MPRPLTPSQRAVAECNLKLAVFLADRYAKAYGLDAQEVRSVAFEALTLAASTYDPTLSKPGRYFGIRIHGGIRDWIRKRRLDAERLPTVRFGSEEPASALDHAADLADEDEAEYLLRFANPRCRELLRLLFYEGLDRGEAGSLIGVKRSQVNNLLAKASRKVRSFSGYHPEK